MGMPCLPLWWIFFHFTYWLSSKGHLDSLHLLSLQWILVFFSYQDILRADSYYLGIFIGYTVIVWCVHRNMKYSYANIGFDFFFSKRFLLCVWVFCLQVCMCITGVLDAFRAQKMHQIPWNWMVVSCHVDVGKQTYVVCKSSRYSCWALSLAPGIRVPISSNTISMCLGTWVDSYLFT